MPKKRGKRQKAALLGPQTRSQSQAAASHLGVVHQPQKEKLSRKQKKRARLVAEADAIMSKHEQAEREKRGSRPSSKGGGDAPSGVGNVLPYRPPSAHKEKAQANARHLGGSAAAAEQLKRRQGRGGGGGWSGGLYTLPPPETPLDLLNPADARPILLFDLNGTLTSHTSMRRSSGVNLMRPGTQHLRRLSGRFRLGLFSSATYRTVETVLPMLERAAGAGPPLFGDRSLILSRGHTQEASKEHKAGGGRAWDTVKPLSKWFSRLHRVLLVDDDAYKACPGEERNMVRVPCWDESAGDACLETLARVLLHTLDGLDEGTDVRAYSRAVSDSLAAALLGDRLAAATVT